MDINPMIAGAMKKIFKSIDADTLVEEIRIYLANNKL